MFEKFTKKFTTKTTDTIKKSFNDRIDEYGDIIQIGLVLSVIILGGRHLTKRNNRKNATYYPEPMDFSSGQPIVINNYYGHEREETRYERRERRTEKKSDEPRHSYQKRENRR